MEAVGKINYKKLFKQLKIDDVYNYAEDVRAAFLNHCKIYVSGHADDSREAFGWLKVSGDAAAELLRMGEKIVFIYDTGTFYWGLTEKVS